MFPLRSGLINHSQSLVIAAQRFRDTHQLPENQLMSPPYQSYSAQRDRLLVTLNDHDKLAGVTFFDEFGLSDAELVQKESFRDQGP